jgi:4-diphosphocytidyl-2-C-methyl-D-erythritol kinase
VVAISSEYVSTPAAYTSLDKLYSDFDGSIRSEGGERLDKMLSAISEGRVDTDSLYNIFEDAVLPTAEGARRIKEQLYELGAISALMSGSGPSVFGIFESREQALLAQSALADSGYRAYFATSV